jgi:hypothetical protein
MSKTPEELAIDYCEPILSDDYAKEIGREDWVGTRCVKVGEGHEMYKAFLAGYKAAQETYKVAIEAYENVAQQMMDEAVRIMIPAHEIAEDVLGASKVIDPIEKLIEDKFWEQQKPKVKL